MTTTRLLSASALILALGVAGASAEPFAPTTSYRGDTARMVEGRAAVIDGPAYYMGPSGYVQSTGPSSVILQEFHEGK